MSRHNRTDDLPRPEDIPNSGRWMHYFIVLALLLSLAMPVLSDKPWERIGAFWEKKVEPILPKISK